MRLLEILSTLLDGNEDVNDYSVRELFDVVLAITDIFKMEISITGRQPALTKEYERLLNKIYDQNIDDDLNGEIFEQTYNMGMLLYEYEYSGTIDSTIVLLNKLDELTEESVPKLKRYVEHLENKTFKSETLQEISEILVRISHCLNYENDSWNLVIEELKEYAEHIKNMN